MKQIFGFKNVNDTIWFEETLQPGVLVARAGIRDRTMRFTSRGVETT
jgi:hypothetical protein